MIKEVYAMKKFLKIMLIIIGAISLIFVALIGIGLFVDVEYDDHIENGRYTYVPEEENKDNEYVEFTINYICLFNYLFISSQMSAKPYFIGSTGILPLW